MSLSPSPLFLALTTPGVCVCVCVCVCFVEGFVEDLFTVIQLEFGSFKYVFKSKKTLAIDGGEIQNWVCSKCVN